VSGGGFWQRPFSNEWQQPMHTIVWTWLHEKEAQENTTMIVAAERVQCNFAIPLQSLDTF
jgi:hypothetical protein